MGGVSKHRPHLISSHIISSHHITLLPGAFPPKDPVLTINTELRTITIPSHVAKPPPPLDAYSPFPSSLCLHLFFPFSLRLPEQKRIVDYEHTSPHRTTSYRTLPYYTSPHRILQFLTLLHLTAPHLTTPYLTQSRKKRPPRPPTSLSPCPHLISSHLISSQLQP